MPPADSRRVELLNAARRLAARERCGAAGKRMPVSHVRIASVAERAGVTRAAIYRYWPSQDEFWEDLADYIAQPDDDRERSSLLGRPAAGPPTFDSVTLVLDAAQSLLLSDPLPLIRTAIVGSSGTSQSVRRHTYRAVDELTQSFVQALDMCGRRTSGDLTPRDLAVATAAVGNGLAVAGRLAREDDLVVSSMRPSPNDAVSTSLLAAAIHSIGGNLTEPCPPGAPSAAFAEDLSTPSLDPDAPVGVAGSAERRADRRADLLAVGMELALELPGPEGMLHAPGHLSFASIARASDVTSRTLFNLWPTHGAFQVDLLAHLLDIHRSRIVDAVDVVPGTLASSVCADRAFLEFGERVHDAVSAQLDDISHLAFVSRLHDPAVVDQLADLHDSHVRALALALDRLLSFTGRVVREGASTRHLALLTVAVADGVARIAHTDPALVTSAFRTAAGHNTLTALMLHSILKRFTTTPRRDRPAEALASMLG